jgi:hypothetical protein
VTGGLFDVGEDAVAIAFQNGIDKINTDRTVAKQSQLRNITFHIPQHDSFTASKKGKSFSKKKSIICYRFNCTPDHLLLDGAPNIGPLISRWELDKFKNCLNKSFRTSKILTLLYQQFPNLLISQRDMSGPRLGTLFNNRWSGGTVSTEFVRGKWRWMMHLFCTGCLYSYTDIEILGWGLVKVTFLVKFDWTYICPERIVLKEILWIALLRKEKKKTWLLQNKVGQFGRWSFHGKSVWNAEARSGRDLRAQELEHSDARAEYVRRLGRAAYRNQVGPQGREGRAVRQPASSPGITRQGTNHISSNLKIKN